MSCIQIKKTLILIFSVALTLLIVEYILKELMKSIRTDTIGKINAVLEHKLDAELTLWGSSTAEVNFNPKLIEDSLNLSSFNMGISGTNIDQYNGLLNEFLSYTKKSKFVVIALDIHGGLAKRTQLYHLHNWLHHIDNRNIFKSLSDIDEESTLKLKYVPFYSLIKYDKHSFSFFRKAMFNNEIEYRFPELGYSAVNTIMELDSLDYKSSVMAPYSFEVFKKLRGVAEKAIENNIRPIIVITPCYYKGLKAINNSEDVINLIKSLEKFGITVFDFSQTEISFDHTNFKDNTHLNVQGANKLTLQLIEKVKTIY